MSESEYLPDIQANWPYTVGYPVGDDAFYDIANTVGYDIERLDSTLDTVYEQRFLDSATGDELDRFAREVGTSRESGETDDSLRLRTTIRKAGTRSSGTVYDLAVVLEIIFGDKTSDITVTSSVNEPVIELRMPQSMIDDIPLSTTELETALQRFTVPSSDAINIVTDDAWLLGTSGSQGLGNGGLI